MRTRRNPTAPLLLALFSAAILGQRVQAEPIKWRNNLDAAKMEANRTGKLVLLHFYTTTCGPCKKLERDVFSQPQITAAMEREYVPVKLDADISPAIAHAYQINRVPSEVVLTPQGNVVQKLSCPLEPNAYGAQLVNVAQFYKQHTAGRSGSQQAQIHSAYAGLKIGQQNRAPNQPAVAQGTPYQAAAQQTASTNAPPPVPNVTQNPYFRPTPRATQQAAATPATAQPAAPAQPRVATNTPALPNNAMPNSYRNRYAVETSTPKVPVAAPSATNSVPAPTATANNTKSSMPVQQAQVVESQPLETKTLEAKTLETEASEKVAAAPAEKAKQPVVATPPAAAAPQLAATSVVKEPETTAPTLEPTPDQTLAAIAPAAAEPWPPQLPPGTPPLAFDGYCPISLQQEQKWVRGNKTFGAIHRGRTYLFVGETQRKQFLANPDAFSPVFSGNDPVLMLDENKVVAGDRKFGFEYRGAFYLFSSKDTMEKFARKPDSYSASVRQAMNRMDASANGTMRR